MLITLELNYWIMAGIIELMPAGNGKYTTTWPNNDPEPEWTLCHHVFISWWICVFGNICNYISKMSRLSLVIFTTIGNETPTTRVVNWHRNVHQWMCLWTMSSLVYMRIRRLTRLAIADLSPLDSDTVCFIQYNDSDYGEHIQRIKHWLW